MSQNALNSLSSRITLWQSQINQVMRFVSIFTREQTEDYLDNIVNFNTNYLSFHLIKSNSKKEIINKSFAFTPKTKSENFQDKAPKAIKKLIYQYGIDSVKKILTTTKIDKPLYLQTASAQIGLPTITIIVPALIGKGEYHWGVLTVWQRPITKALPHNEQTNSFFVGSDGSILASSKISDAIKPNKYKSLEVVKLAIRGKSEAGTKEYKNKEKK